MNKMQSKKREELQYLKYKLKDKNYIKQLLAGAEGKCLIKEIEPTIRTGHKYCASDIVSS